MHDVQSFTIASLFADIFRFSPCRHRETTRENRTPDADFSDMQLEALFQRKHLRRHMRCGAFFALGKRFRTPSWPQSRECRRKTQKFAALGRFLCILMKIFILHGFYFTHLQADMCWCEPHTTANVYKLFLKTPNLHFSAVSGPQSAPPRCFFARPRAFPRHPRPTPSFSSSQFFFIFKQNNLSSAIILIIGTFFP